MPRRPPTSDATPQLSYAPPVRDRSTLSRIFRVLNGFSAWILLPTLLVAIIAVVLVQMIPPQYTAETRILLESRASAASERASPIDERAMASQIRAVMSRDLAREAIRRLDLTGNPEFDATAGASDPIRRILTLAGIGSSSLDEKPEDRLLESYFERLLVHPADGSRSLQVEFRAADPDLAAKAANTISELYVASLEAAKVDAAGSVSMPPDSDIDALRARVAEAEAKVDAYRLKNGMIASGAAIASPGSRQPGESSGQLLQARTIQAELAGRVKLLKEMIKDGRAFEIPDVANGEMTRRTVESRTTLRAQLALESRTLLPAHPRIKELTAQIEDLDKQIKAAAERVVRTVENDAKIAGARVASLQANAQGEGDVVARGVSGDIQLQSLEREAKLQREQLEAALTRSGEASARDADSARLIDARIVSRATAPELPSFPKTMSVVGFASVLAFLICSAAVLYRHLRGAPHDLDRRADVGQMEAAPLEQEEPVAEGLEYPEPMPPEQAREPARFAPAYGGFENVVTANVSFPWLVTGDAGLRKAVAPREVTKVHAAAPQQDDRHALATLIERLGAVGGNSGRCVLVVETTVHDAETDGLAASLARTLSASAPTLSVEVSGRATDRRVLGLTDLVAGEAAFPEVIRPVAGSRHHVVGAGVTDRAVLLDEPQGLAIGLNAMAQAYDWVICRFDTSSESDDDLLAALSACMDSVVIASDAEPDDADLVALYGLATEAGARQVLVARDTGADPTEPEMQLRLSA